MSYPTNTDAQSYSGRAFATEHGDKTFAPEGELKFAMASQYLDLICIHGLVRAQLEGSQDISLKNGAHSSTRGSR